MVEVLPGVVVVGHTGVHEALVGQLGLAPQQTGEGKEGGRERLN